ncbi:radical SAM protein [Candidatus Woesearchaeota archaeon]|nr:radical SAM protein [Candidatus Woesearchaeota archaeon]
MNKIRVAFVNPSLTREEKLGKSAKYTSAELPPIGLCYLAAVMREKGYEVKIIDAPGQFMSIEETIKEVLEFKAEYVCLAATIISIFPAADFTNELAHKSNAKVILGGPHVTAVPEETMERFPEFKIAIIGEAETTLPELVKTIENEGDLKEVDGLILNLDDKLIKTRPRKLIQNLDDLPLPAYDLIPNLAEKYRPSKLTYHRLPSTSIITSRGCPHQCTFCDRSVFGNKWRFHSAEYIMKVIMWLHKDFGIVDFFFVDDHFTVNKERAMKICNAIIDSKLDITWAVIGRVDYVDAEMLKRMKEAGCKQVSYGLESGSQRILDFLKKGVTLEKIRWGVKITKEIGLEVKGLFMVGTPTETKETLDETMNFIKELKLDCVNVGAFTPIPGAEIYEDAKKYGEFEADWRKMNLWDVTFVPHGLTKEYIEQFVKRCDAKEIKTADEMLQERDTPELKTANGILQEIATPEVKLETN